MALELAFGILSLILFLVVLYLISVYSSQSRTISNLRTGMTEQVRSLFDEWRQTEIDGIKSQFAGVAQQEAKALLDQWVVTQEEGIRKDAVLRSMAVVTGKVTEHIAPFLPGFKYNPKDARFIGSPVDLVVFDGYSEGEPKNIIFIEVKSGSSSLTTKERKLRNLVQARAVSWEEMHVASTTSSELAAALGETTSPAGNGRLDATSQTQPANGEPDVRNPATLTLSPPALPEMESPWQEIPHAREHSGPRIAKEVALERMTRALDAAKRARDAGRDVRSVRRALKDARAAFERGDYAEALLVADRIVRELQSR